MWGDRRYTASSALPPAHSGQRMTKSAPCSPVKPLLKPRPPSRADSFHVIHKVPVGDSPYVKAKHVQLVDKEPDKAIALFWAAINAGDRVDSALKDMAIVMKQQNRPEEAIEAIRSLRDRCSDQAQESLDNVLLDLYKRCGRLDDQIVLLKHKLELIYAGLAFNGKRTKTARSQGKKFQVSIEQEATRLLGNLGWAYMQQSNFVAAEAVYRKALSMEADNNKVCNLGICLMKQGRLEEAKLLLLSVTPACSDPRWGTDSHLKSYERAQEMLREMEDPEAAQQQSQPQQQPQSAAARSLFAPVVARKLAQPQQQQRAAFAVPYDDGEEEDDLLDFEADETDENANSNIAAVAAAAAAGLFQDQQQQQHAEALKKRLEMLCRNSNSSSTTTNNTINGNAAGYPSANYSPNKPPRCTSRPSSTTRRSLSLGSFDHLQPPGFGLSQQQPPPQQQLQRAAKLPLVTSNSTSIVVMPTTPSREQQQQPNVSEIVSMMSSCSFGDLGFIESPKAVDFATPVPATGGPGSNRISSDRCQQRLRVFQDITTAAPSSPLAR